MGPLSGLKVVELAGLAPGPFCGMLLADLGAEVLRVDRPETVTASRSINPMERGKRTIGVDLKDPAGIELFLDLVAEADAVIDVFRPGTAERLGIGPAPCLARNPKLVYGRLTGWGQDGPLAPRAGHDIDYIALAGALDPIGRAGGAPVIPLNLLGDFAGGGMLLALGILAALYEARDSGRGQVVDAAMTDGAALLLAPILTARALGSWGERGTNELDGGAPYYDVYRTADDKYVAIGTIEPKFYAELIKQLGASDDPAFAAQRDRTTWPRMRERFAEIFATRTRDEWSALLEDTDSCFAPVLAMDEARHHRQHQARGSFLEVDGLPQPAPAPRFDRTPLDRPGPATLADEKSLSHWGVDTARLSELAERGIAKAAED